MPVFSGKRSYIQAAGVNETRVAVDYRGQASGALQASMPSKPVAMISTGEQKPAGSYCLLSWRYSRHLSEPGGRTDNARKKSAVNDGRRSSKSPIRSLASLHPALLV